MDPDGCNSIFCYCQIVKSEFKIVREKAHTNAVFYLETHCRGQGSLCYRVASCRATALSHWAFVLLLTALLANQNLYLKVAGNWRELMSHSKLTVASQSQEGLRVASQSEEGLMVASQSELVEPQATKNNRRSIQQGSE